MRQVVFLWDQYLRAYFWHCQWFKQIMLCLLVFFYFHFYWRESCWLTICCSRLIKIFDQDTLLVIGNTERSRTISPAIHRSDNPGMGGYYSGVQWLSWGVDGSKGSDCTWFNWQQDIWRFIDSKYAGCWPVLVKKMLVMGIQEDRWSFLTLKVPAMFYRVSQAGACLWSTAESWSVYSSWAFCLLDRLSSQFVSTHSNKQNPVSAS